MTLRSLLAHFGLDAGRYVDDEGNARPEYRRTDSTIAPPALPFEPLSREEGDRIMAGVEEDLAADAEERAGLGLLDPWDDDAKEGRDYDVIMHSRTYSVAVPTGVMIDELLATHRVSLSQPDVLSFAIEVGAVDERNFAGGDLHANHVATFIEASMEGRRPR